MQSGSYGSLQALEKDVESAVAEILASGSGNESSSAPPSAEETRLQAKALAFQKVLKNLIEREDARKAHAQRKETDTDADKPASNDQGTPVPIKEEWEPEPLQNRTVLTLYGTAQVPKQLFSSLQQPRTIPPTDGASTFDTSVKITLPLRESSLPNFMSTTEVYPLSDTADFKKSKPSTIGNVFRAPAHLPQISPPKIANPTVARGNTITFAPLETPKPRRKGSQSYAHQQLAAGSWLGYGGIDIPKDQISPTAKQKSRQRALSTGEAQQPPAESTLVAVQQARDDALFRSVYSSFAPTRDDASAIVPEETKNRVWWQKVGESRFNEMFPIDPALLDTEEAVEAEVSDRVDEEENFKEAVDNFVPAEENPFVQVDHRSEAEKNTDEILQEISELLETLASYQRIRNSSLTTNPRTPVVQNSSLASLAGSPLTPSSEEIDVYSMLKSQLTVMVSMLPPYAVAKLNGDQLEELNISRTILFDTKEYRGVLEEDQLSRLAKAPAPVATPATLTRTGSGTLPHYASGNTQYARATPSAHASTARPVQATPLHYPQQALHRSSSIHLQRSPSGPTQGFQAGATYPSSRSGFPATSSYNQQTPRASYGQTASGQYYPQRSAQPSNYGGPVSSQYQATPQSQTQNRYASQQGQNGYYPRSQNVAPMYNTTQTPQARTVSPIKGAPAPMPPSYGARPSGYGTPVSGGQLRSTYYGPSQYGATPQAPVSSAYNPQQMMIDRQQAQAAAQSQARLAAQNSFNSRQGSGTPQPPNGSYAGQANGASMST